MLAYNLYSHFISGRHEQIFPLRQRHTKDIALTIKECPHPLQAMENHAIVTNVRLGIYVVSCL